MKVLVFSPHPDDEVIGCGGAILAHRERGDVVTVAYLTSGENGSLKYSQKNLIEVREKEAQASAKILGVDKTLFLHLPDGFIEYNADNLTALTKLIRSEQPQLIYFPHSQDGHVDHQVAHLLIKEAAGRASGDSFAESGMTPWSVDTLLGYEVWTPIQEPQYSVDISAQMERKLAALRQHKSQLENVQYDEAVAGLNRYRGIMTKAGKYAECFEVMKTSLIL